MNKRFSYKALDSKNNKMITGKIEAPSDIAVEQILAESNLILISTTEIKESFLLNILTGGGKITTKEMITLFITLEQFEHAGVPLLDSLKDLASFSENPKMKSMMQNIYESVKGGELLSAAMEKFPKVFDEVSISLVAMGEKTGNLDTAFKNIAENLKWNAEMKRKTVKAVKSPLFSLGLLLGVAVVLLKFVVPKVLSFILEQDIEIPPYTTALINTSNFVQENFFKIVTIFATIFVLIRIGLTNKEFRIKFDNLKLKLPLLGQIMVKLDISRFTKFFGITFSAGIPVLQCIDIANNVVVNRYLKNEIEYIKTKVSEGKTMSKCIEDSEVFPFVVKRMFKVGEESGNIESAMENIQYFYNTEINDSIDKIVGSIQPMILFFMGGLMCWIIAAVFGPVYGNFANIS
ncbi:MAG: type II secretion system F family protein [Rickettsiales bacterium]|nr:type II secretion system F family protein [Rickettsiales bacterium]